MITLLLWPLIALGGADVSTAVPFAIVCLVYAAVVAGRLEGAFDKALVLLIAAVLLQLVPLPADVVRLLSPPAESVRDQLALHPVATAAWHPLALDPAGTSWAAVELVGTTAFFLAARERLATGGLRRSVRSIAAIGFGVSLLAIVQAGTTARSIYWLFPTPSDAPLPFGPFVNRQHFATWAIMALPLCVGYLTARAEARKAALRVETPSRGLDLSDDRTLWLSVTSATLLVALLLSLSRSGAIALGTSSIATMLLARRAVPQKRLRVLVGSIAVLTALAIGWADLQAVRERIAGTTAETPGRLEVWRETIPVIREFPWAGTGSGSYELAMRVYQRSDRRVYFNQAQNHYLQLLAEGGVLVAVPFVLAIVFFIRTARDRLARDRSGLWWIRVGAACGLGAVAMQSLWETGLTLSANAALAAVLAAIVVHRRREPGIS
jgi:O-antigen ligase